LSRELAQLLSAATAGILSDLLELPRPVPASRIRSSSNVWVVRPENPAPPVQIDFALTVMVPDLKSSFEQMRRMAAAALVVTLHTLSVELVGPADVRLVRSTLWFADAEYNITLDPATKLVVASYGGHRYVPGYMLPELAPAE
jgi:hypothetical protein